VPQTAVPSDDLKVYIKSKIFERWQNQWNNVPSSNKLKSIKLTIQPWNSPPNLSRRETVVLSRLHLGHSLLTHGHLFLRQPPPSCDLCNSRLTLVHVVLECPKFDQFRQLTNLPKDLSSIFADDPHAQLRLLSFVKAAGLFSKI